MICQEAAMVKRARAPGTGIETLDRLYGRTGFLLRRAHQLADGVFQDECAALALTAPQCGCLIVAYSCPGLDQSGIAGALGVDRATTGQILHGLEQRGLIVRRPAPDDARRRCIVVTAQGRKLLESAGPALERAHQRLVAPLSAEERRTLTALLERLCEAFNAEAKAPLVKPQESER
jgi:MarR family transcriptional regulator, lower aerobic nicotinate degradation pathway regulator